MGATVATGEERVLFRSPDRFLSGLDAATTAEVVACSADVALILEGGVIRDVALGSRELAEEGYDRAWKGKAWADTVTRESRPKIRSLLEDGSQLRWRQVNHPSSTGLDLPVRYRSVEMPGRPWRIALGRELRSVSALQQRLVEAQQNLERDYASLREAETRYRLLFQQVPQPVLVTDAEGVLEELNPAAARALGSPKDGLVGRPIARLFSSRSRRRVGSLLEDALSSGQADLSDLRLEQGGACHVSASAFRQGQAIHLIVRLQLVSPEAAETSGQSILVGVIDELPDGFLVAGEDLRVLAANRALVGMTGRVGKSPLLGTPVGEILGRSASDLNVLISNLKSQGVVRNFVTVVRDHLGQEEEVELAAVAAPSGEGTVFGFSVRGIARRLRLAPRIDERLPSSAEQLTELVGSMPLRDIVRRSTDLIEKLCIEAALDLTQQNRASAAEMLGLSRQSLYTKLRRFGFDSNR